MHRHLHRGRWLAACLALLLGLSGLVISAAVVFSEFKATKQSTGSILVEWKTAAELNSAAFNLYRATEVPVPLDEAHLIHQEEATGSGTTGAAYAYLDAATEPGVCYTYMIAELTSSGSFGGKAGPVAAGDNCSTATPTVTVTPTTTPPATPAARYIYLPLMMH